MGAVMSIFPFREGEWRTVRDLREAAANILARTASDKEFAAAMRAPDSKRSSWRSLSLAFPFDQIQFDQVAVALDGEPRVARRDSSCAKMRSSGFVEPHGDAEPVKLFEHVHGQTLRRDGKLGWMIHRCRAVRPLTDVAQLKLCSAHERSS